MSLIDCSKLACRTPSANRSPRGALAALSPGRALFTHPTEGEEGCVRSARRFAPMLAGKRCAGRHLELHSFGRRLHGQEGGRKGGEEDGGRKKAAKRELIDTGTDKRFVRRGAGGQVQGIRRRREVAHRGSPQEGQDQGEVGQGDKGDR